MTSVQLATMSTALWVIATTSLFILLAGWSSGESWGLTASFVRGVRGWAEQDARMGATSSPFVEQLGPLFVPKRPIGGAAAVRLLSVARASAIPPSMAPLSPGDPTPAAEVVDLGERHLPRE
ncbi:MAG: hypothetical protein ABI620_00725 [Chloroflexota bacterium]